MYKINRIDVQALSNKEIETMYLFNKSIVNKYNLLDTYNDIEKYKKLFISDFISEDKELYTLTDDTSINGIITFTKMMSWNNKEEYQLEITILPSNLDKDLFNTIDSFIHNKLNKYNQIVVMAYNDELKELINKYNNKVRGRSNCYTLKRDDININELNKWIEKLECKNKDLEIVFTDSITEEYLEQYCNLFTETMEDMTNKREEGYEQYIITPDIQRQNNDAMKKNNKTHYCYMIFNSKNEMIAKSNLGVNRNDIRFPYQFMIGVKREYRGRGLGKWLYASMYKKLYENVKFEKAWVLHHCENIPAIKVSQSIGYRFSYLQNEYILYK